MHHDAEASHAGDCCAGGKCFATARSSDVDNTAAGSYCAESTMEEFALQSDAVRAPVQEQVESTD